MQRRRIIELTGLAALGAWLAPSPTGASERFLVLAQATDKPPQDDSPEARMNRRFPQKVRAGDLIGLPVLDDYDVTLGHVQKVMRTPEGKIRLIVSYSRWFGWFGRPVAVPIEVVFMFGRQLASVDMQPAEYEKAPTWTQGNERAIPDDEILRIAVNRR